MRTVVLYGNRNPCMVVLMYLMAKRYRVVLVVDDEELLWLVKLLGVYVSTLEDALNMKYDLFLCVHGRRIISKEKLRGGKMVNIHPTNYNGHNPVKRYIENTDEYGTIRALHITELVDEGERVSIEVFNTGVCNSYADFYNVALEYYPKLVQSVLNKLGI